MENNLKEAILLASRYCSNAERCLFDVTKKLVGWKVDEQLFDEVFQFLLNEKFVDEERFARAFVNDKFKFNHWGRVKIRQHLKQRQISDNNISVAFNECIDVDEYLSVIKDLAEKKSATVKAETAYQRKMKIAQFVQGRGFEPHLIMDVLDDMSLD